MSKNKKLQQIESKTQSEGTDENIFKILTPSKKMLEKMKAKRALVYHKNSTVRVAAARALSELGIPTQMTSICSGSYQDLKEELEKEAPDILIVSNDIDGQTFEEILTIHEKLKSDRLEASFFLLSEDGSLSAALVQLDYFIDGFIVIPFTSQTLNNTIIERLEAKSSPSKPDRIFNAAREKFILEDYIEAYNLFESACQMDELQSMALYFLGKISLKKGDVDKALEYFADSYKHSDENYMCLAAYSKLLMDQKKFKESYEINKKFIDTFPIRPKFVRQTILLALANHKQDDIEELTEIIPTLRSVSQENNNILAAGLIICAKYLFEGGCEKPALKSIRNCFALAPDRPQILEEGCIVLASNGHQKKAITILEKNSGIKMPKSVFLQIQMEIYYHSEDYDNILKIGQNIINAQTNGSRCHRIFLEVAGKMKLGENQIQRVLDDAKKKFPDENITY
ncbi:MAG: hypothetical protein HOE90_12770 [Bacteriovoracaceae bacterium]|jgi:tetratricopeptide (TPR) repeat protein|nr:hypothetical protein [Bacteriovoracaceae bacterium]